jgi:hypothetical protein
LAAYAAWSTGAGGGLPAAVDDAVAQLSADVTAGAGAGR